MIIIEGKAESIINDVERFFEGHRKVVRTSELAVKGYLSEYVKSTKEEMSREFLPDITAINSFNEIVGRRYHTSYVIVEKFQKDISRSGIDGAIESIEFSLFAEKKKVDDTFFKFLENNSKILSKPFTVLHTPPANWPKGFDFPKPAKIEMSKDIYTEAKNTTGRKEWLEYVIKYTRDDVKFRIKHFNIKTDYLTESVIKVADLIEKLKNYRRKFGDIEEWKRFAIEYDLMPSIREWRGDSSIREKNLKSIIGKGAERLKTDYMDYLKTTIQKLSNKNNELEIPLDEDKRLELAMQLYTKLPRGRQIFESKPSNFRGYITGTLNKHLGYSAIDDVMITSPDEKSVLIKLYTPLDMSNRICDIEIYGK